MEKHKPLMPNAEDEYKRLKILMPEIEAFLEEIVKDKMNEAGFCYTCGKYGHFKSFTCGRAASLLAKIGRRNHEKE